MHRGTQGPAPLRPQAKFARLAAQVPFWPVAQAFRGQWWGLLTPATFGMLPVLRCQKKHYCHAGSASQSQNSFNPSFGKSQTPSARVVPLLKKNKRAMLTRPGRPPALPQPLCAHQNDAVLSTPINILHVHRGQARHSLVSTSQIPILSALSIAHALVALLTGSSHSAASAPLASLHREPASGRSAALRARMRSNASRPVTSILHVT